MAIPEVRVTNAVNSISPSTAALSIMASDETPSSSIDEHASIRSDDEERRRMVVGCMAISNTSLTRASATPAQRENGNSSVAVEAHVSGDNGEIHERVQV